MDGSLTTTARLPSLLPIFSKHFFSDERMIPMTRAQLESKKTAAQAEKNDAEQAVKDASVAAAFIEKARAEFAAKQQAAEGAAREAQAEIDKL